MKLLNTTIALFAITLSTASHAAPSSEKISNDLFKIEAANDEWTSTGIKANTGDIIIIQEDGNKITLGAWVGKLGADGAPNGDMGALLIKVGTGASKKIGAHGFIVITEPGTVKLKVSDTNYKDNSGFFFPSVIRVPASLIPVGKEIIISE